MAAARQRRGDLGQAARAYRLLLGASESPDLQQFALAQVQACEQPAGRPAAPVPPSKKLSKDDAAALTAVMDREFTESTEHFVVRARNPQLAKLLAGEAEVALDRICRVILAGQEYPHSVTINVWPDHQAYRAHAVDAPEWSGGSFRLVTAEGVTTRQIDLTQRDAKGQFAVVMLDRVLPHEMCHLVVQEFFGDSTCPLFLNEGLAMMAESDADLSRARITGKTIAGAPGSRWRPCWSPSSTTSKSRRCSTPSRSASSSSSTSGRRGSSSARSWSTSVPAAPPPTPSSARCTCPPTTASSPPWPRRGKTTPWSRLNSWKPSRRRIAPKQGNSLPRRLPSPACGLAKPRLTSQAYVASPHASRHNRLASAYHHGTINSVPRPFRTTPQPSGKQRADTMDLEASSVPHRVYAEPVGGHVSLGRSLRLIIHVVITAAIGLPLAFAIGGAPCEATAPWFAGTLVVVLFLVGVVVRGLRVAAQWNAASSCALGKFRGIKGPGVLYVIPVLDFVRFVDTRVLALNIPSQKVITKDNVPAATAANRALRAAHRRGDRQDWGQRRTGNLGGAESRASRIATLRRAAGGGAGGAESPARGWTRMPKTGRAEASRAVSIHPPRETEPPCLFQPQPRDTPTLLPM